VVAQLDRLTRDAAHWRQLIDRFTAARGELYVADLGMSVLTGPGRSIAMWRVQAGQDQYEEERRRTKDGMAGARARGRSAGSPAIADRPELIARIQVLRASAPHSSSVSVRRPWRASD